MENELHPAGETKFSSSGDDDQQSLECKTTFNHFWTRKASQCRRKRFNTKPAGAETQWL